MSRKNRIDAWLNAAYAECIEPLRKYLRRIVGSPETAEDLAHDAFLRVYTAKNFDEKHPSQGYLFIAARNLALSRKTLHSVAKTDTVEEIADIRDEQGSVEQQVMTTEEFDVLCKAMARLTPQQNDVLTLYAFFGHTYQEIADHLKVSKATVHREMSRALETVHAAQKQIEGEKAAPLNGKVTVLKHDRKRGP